MKKRNSLAVAPNKHVPFKSIKELVNATVADSADKVAYRFRTKDGVKDVTYSEHQKNTHYLGTALCDIGMGSAHIGCCAENSYNWITVYFTALQSGGVFCPIDKELPESDLINIINNGDDDIIFCDKRHEDMFRNIRAELPKVKYFVCFDREEDEDEYLSFNKFMAKGKELYEAGNKDFLALSRDPKELKMLIYTSGTTGLAKGVMLSEHNLCSMVHYGLDIATIRPVGLSLLPYHHSYEAVAGIIVAMHDRRTLCINDSLKRVVKNLALYQPDYMFVVPALVEILYRRINANIEEKGKTKTIKLAIKLSNALRYIGIDLRRVLFKEIHQAFGGNLVKIVCGGAPLRAEIGKFFDDIGVIVCNGYGITECSPLVSVNLDDDNDPATVGVPLECIKVKIDNPNEDGEGEICVIGDSVMMGYYKNPEATNEVFDDDGYFHTGDYGKFDHKGRIIITGRKKNIIILGNGKNIYPEELEGYVGGIKYVTESIVYGARDEEGKEAELAIQCIIDPETLESMPREELQEKLKNDIYDTLKDLPTYKQITKIIIRETPFVKTTTNKIRRAKDGSPM